MLSNHRILRRLPLLGVMLVAVVATGSAVRAQNNDEPIDDDNPKPANAVANRVNQQANQINQMDQWVFGRLGGSAAARTKLDSLLLLSIQDLDRNCGLTEAQKNKLRLAGRGDIKRFFDKVEALKRTLQQGQNDPNANIWQEVQPLQNELKSGLFGDSSFCAKTIRHTLDSDQSARFESLSRERTAFRFRTTIECFVAHLDSGLGLTELQRQRLIELLVTRVRPSQRFRHGEYFFLMLHASKLPEAELKSIFDAPQWRLLSRQLMQGRAMAQRLRAAGALAEIADEPAPIHVAPAVPLRTAGPDAKAVKTARP